MASPRERRDTTLPDRTTHRESVEDRQRRAQAQRVLNSYEQLVWHSMVRHETLAQTRKHFQAIAAGFDAPAGNSGIQFDNTPLPDAYTCVGGSSDKAQPLKRKAVGS